MNYNPTDTNDTSRHPPIPENAGSPHGQSSTNKAYKHNHQKEHKGRKSPHSAKTPDTSSPRRVKRKKAGQKSPVRAKRKEKRHKTDPSSPRIRRSRVIEDPQDDNIQHIEHRVTEHTHPTHPDHYMSPTPHHSKHSSHIPVPPAHPSSLQNTTTNPLVHNGLNGWSSNPTPVHMQRAHTISQQTGYHPHPSSTWEANGGGAVNMNEERTVPNKVRSDRIERSHSHEPVPRSVNAPKHKAAKTPKGTRRRTSRRNSEDSPHRSTHSSPSPIVHGYGSRADCIWSIKLFQSHEIASNFRCSICGDVPREDFAFTCEREQIYCEYCIDHELRTGVDVQQKRRMPLMVKNMINELKLKCPRYAQCKFKGTVRTLPDHFASCNTLIATRNSSSGYGGECPLKAIGCNLFNGGYLDEHYVQCQREHLDQIIAHFDSKCTTLEKTYISKLNLVHDEMSNLREENDDLRAALDSMSQKMDHVLSMITFNTMTSSRGFNGVNGMNGMNHRKGYQVVIDSAGYSQDTIRDLPAQPPSVSTGTDPQWNSFVSAHRRLDNNTGATTPDDSSFHSDTASEGWFHKLPNHPLMNPLNIQNQMRINAMNAMNINGMNINGVNMNMNGMSPLQTHINPHGHYPFPWTGFVGGLPPSTTAPANVKAKIGNGMGNANGKNGKNGNGMKKRRRNSVVNTPRDRPDRPRTKHKNSASSGKKSKSSGKRSNNGNSSPSKKSGSKSAGKANGMRNDKNDEIDGDTGDVTGGTDNDMRERNRENNRNENDVTENNRRSHHMKDTQNEDSNPKLNGLNNGHNGNYGTTLHATEVSRDVPFIPPESGSETPSSIRNQRLVNSGAMVPLRKKGQGVNGRDVTDLNIIRKTTPRGGTPRGSTPKKDRGKKKGSTPNTENVTNKTKTFSPRGAYGLSVATDHTITTAQSGQSSFGASSSAPTSVVSRDDTGYELVSYTKSETGAQSLGPNLNNHDLDETSTITTDPLHPNSSHNNKRNELTHRPKIRRRSHHREYNKKPQTPQWAQRGRNRLRGRGRGNTRGMTSGYMSPHHSATGTHGNRHHQKSTIKGSITTESTGCPPSPPIFKTTRPITPLYSNHSQDSTEHPSELDHHGFPHARRETTNCTNDTEATFDDDLTTNGDISSRNDTGTNYSCTISVRRAIQHLVPNYYDDSKQIELSTADDRVVVLDIGSQLSKIGTAGSNKPAAIFQSMVAKHKVNGSRSIGSLLSGMNNIKASNYQCSYPVERGVIKSYDDYESILHSVFYDKLGVNPDDFKSLLIQPMMSPKHQSTKIAELCFEKFGLSALYLAQDALCALYASGGNTGLSISSGHGITSVVPIYEGYVLPHAAETLDFAGCDVTDYLKDKLKLHGMFRSPLSENKFADSLKQKLSYVAHDFKLEKQHTKFERIVYRLPDGSEIDVGQQRFECTEALFSRNLKRRSSGAVNTVIADAVKTALSRSGDDIRRVLFENIVCSGGNTMTKGFDDRLKKEIDLSAPEKSGWKTRVFGLVDRKLSCWIGGSIMASLSHMDQLWISKEQFEEHGTGIMERRSLSR